MNAADQALLNWLNREINTGETKIFVQATLLENTKLECAGHPTRFTSSILDSPPAALCHKNMIRRKEQDAFGIMDRIRGASIKICRHNEQLPRSGGNDHPIGRYTFERDLREYQRKLPDLAHHLSILPPNANVLDIGTGMGVALTEIRERYVHNAVGTCIQHINGMAKGLVQCNAAHLPFRDGTFDLVISVHGLTWEPDQLRALSEILRVSRAGGKAFLCIHPFSHAINMYFGDAFWHELGVSSDEYRSTGKEFVFAMGQCCKSMHVTRRADWGNKLRVRACCVTIDKTDV